MEKTIAICITAHNRNDVTKTCYEWWDVMRPPNSTIFVVDDASDTPINFSDFRFEKQAGIAKAKNKCIELAADYDYVFLVDNDCWPRTSLWWRNYVESGLNHACWIFDRKVVFDKSPKYTEYDLPRGCVLFLTKEAIRCAGGMDPEFGLWGYEHASYSDRIYNMGLTPGRYIDVKYSDYLFYSMDQHKKIQSSINDEIRARLIPINYQRYLQKYKSKDYIPFA